MHIEQEFLRYLYLISSYSIVNLVCQIPIFRFYYLEKYMAKNFNFCMEKSFKTSSKFSHYFKQKCDMHCIDYTNSIIFLPSESLIVTKTRLILLKVNNENKIDSNKSQYVIVPLKKSCCNKTYFFDLKLKNDYLP